MIIVVIVILIIKMPIKKKSLILNKNKLIQI